MTEPSEEMMAMARRITAEQAVPGPASRMILEGLGDDWHGVKSALAAIIETQRADAELVERMAQSTQLIGGLRDWSLSFDERQICSTVATQIRTGNHYGKDESHD